MDDQPATLVITCDTMNAQAGIYSGKSTWDDVMGLFAILIHSFPDALVAASKSDESFNARKFRSRKQRARHHSLKSVEDQKSNSEANLSRRRRGFYVDY